MLLVSVHEEISFFWQFLNDMRNVFVQSDVQVL